MYRAQHPARQLNSKAIRDAISSYVLPTVQRQFCIVSVKCVWRVQSEAESLTRAWELICEKRVECDKAIENTPGVVFFYSAISSCETAKAKKSTKHRSQQESCSSEVEDDDIMSSSQLREMSESSAITSAVENARFPAIAYWIALESPNGAPISTVPMHRQLLKCEVELSSKVLTTTKRAGHLDIVSGLCSVLKDHNSTHMTDVVNDSFRFCFRDALREVDDSEHLAYAEEELRERVVRFVLVKQCRSREMMKQIVNPLVRAGLQTDIEGVDAEAYLEDGNVAQPKAITQDKCTQLINDIEILMSKLGYALCDGEVYRKIQQSRYTYSYKCDVDAFIGSLEGNEFFRTRLLKFGDKVKERLRNPKSQVIRQLIVIHDLIEEDNGWCLSLSQRRFVKDAISNEEVGRTSPRAFFHFDHESTPDGKFFREILENSLDEHQIATFCNDFLNLFKCHSKRHKEKVLCLVGDANSGKTSLFAPVLGVVPPSKIARVTKQKSFNKAMIDEKTEVIFIDEATVNVMDIDDWKILTQGGWTAHDRKFSTAKGFINKCPMLLTSQKELEFLPEDQPAMNARMNVYTFKALQRKDPRAYDWLRRHAIECIVWAMNHAGPLPAATCDSPETSTPEPTTSLNTKEMDELMMFNMDTCLDAADATEVHLEEEVPEMQSSQTSLYDKLQEIDPKSFRGRVYKKLVEREKKSVQEMVEANRRHLIDEGIVDVEESIQLIHDPIDVPTQVRQRIYQKISEEKEEERKKKTEKNLEEATKVYKDAWVLQKEREMFEYCEKRENCVGEMQRTMDSLLQIAEHKLKHFHESRGTLTNEALEERKRVCLALGFVREDMVSAIKNVYHRLPVVIQTPLMMTPPRSVDVSQEVPRTPSWSPKQTAVDSLLKDVPEEEFDLSTPPPTPSYATQRKRKRKSKLASGQKRLTQYLSHSQL